MLWFSVYLMGRLMDAAKQKLASIKAGVSTLFCQRAT